MYFIFVSNDIESAHLFEKALHKSDVKRVLITVPNGYDLIQFLQNIKRGESYPDLIILTSKFIRISGTDLLELLKTDDFYRLIPVVMLLHDYTDDYAELSNRLCAEVMMAPKDASEWSTAISKMCEACS